MINDEPLIFAGQLDHRMMAGARGNLWILLQYFTYSLKRSERRIRYRIGNTIIRSGPSAFRPHKIILPFADKHERTFNITLWRYFFKLGSIIKRNKPTKVSIEFGNIAMSPTAIYQIVLSIFVFKYKL